MGNWIGVVMIMVMWIIVIIIVIIMDGIDGGDEKLKFDNW